MKYQSKLLIQSLIKTINFKLYFYNGGGNYVNKKFARRKRK